MNSMFYIFPLVIAAGCTTVAGTGSDRAAGAVSAAANALCGFVPAAADVAALFEVTGATKVKQAAILICGAAEKRSQELVALKNASEAEGEPKITKLPAGTQITVVVGGKTISGLTTR